MTSVLIYHYVTRGMTGTNELLLQFLRALDRSSLSVEVFMFGEADSRFILELRKYTSKLKYWHLPFLCRTFSSFFKLLFGLILELFIIRRARLRGKHLIVISTNPIVTPIFPHIAYVHYPSFDYRVFLGQYAVFSLRSMLVNRLYGAFIACLILLGEIVVNKLFSRHVRGVLYLTNSAYTAKTIKLLRQKYSIVIHPPIKVINYNRVCRDEEQRMPIVLTISRFAYEKRLHMIPLIAKSIKRPALFIIVGTLKGRMGQEVKDYIVKLCRELGVDDKVKLLPNLDEESKKKILCSSKIYLHTMPNEHFGITVIEAMASELPVIVPNSGGPYEDIIDFGKYGLAYHSLKHAVELIEMLLSDEKQWKHYSRISRVRASEYNFDVFKLKINKVLSTYLNVIKQYGR